MKKQGFCILAKEAFKYIQSIFNFLNGVLQNAKIEFKQRNLFIFPW